MKSSCTAERLKYLIESRNIRQVDILELCKPYCIKYGVKMNKSDLSQYLKGKTEPNQDKLVILSMALKVNETWLMGYDEPMENEKTEYYENYGIQPISTQRLPLLGEIACGEPIFANEDRESYIESGIGVKADFCLKAKGDSMIGARIYNGDIVFVKQQPTVNNGEVAVVIINDEAVLKRVYYYPENQKLVLQSENPKFEPFVFIGDELDMIRILGKAVAFQSDII